MGTIPIFQNNDKKKRKKRKVCISTSIIAQLNVRANKSVELEGSAAAVRGHLSHKPPHLQPAHLYGQRSTQLGEMSTHRAGDNTATGHGRIPASFPHPGHRQNRTGWCWAAWRLNTAILQHLQVLGSIATECTYTHSNLLSLYCSSMQCIFHHIQYLKEIACSSRALDYQRSQMSYSTSFGLSELIR